MRSELVAGAGRTLLVAVAAVAFAIAITAALLATPVSAQSDDETAGRIVARLLEDGRVEFGWQPAGGERVLPRARYFPTDAEVDKWLNSSPVEVDGAEIGRINARRLSDGRIEFAFTPTGRERILTDARYFPTNARPYHWLRSTEITIGPPEDDAPRYTAVSAGDLHTCAIRTDGEITCWGSNETYSGLNEETQEHLWLYIGQANPPPGSYTAVSAGDKHTCAIHASDRTLDCWGIYDGYWRQIDFPEGGTISLCDSRTSECWQTTAYSGQTDAPEGRFTTVSAGGAHTCAIRESNDQIACWGWNGFGQADAPEGRFTAVSAGAFHSCGLRASREIACWGISDEEEIYVGETDAPTGRYTAISAGNNHTCAIRESQEIACWGQNSWGQTDAPTGHYTAVSVGSLHTCAIRESQEIACWGGYREQTDAPDGNFTAVSAGYAHTCAIRESGEIECWGRNEYGQATPPN